MKDNVTRKAFDNKKVRAKGKIFRDCYFEGCILMDDEHTIYIDCYMYGVKSSKRSRGIDCIVRNSNV